MIQADQLTRHYGDMLAVNALSFHVRKGEVMGLLGPNGAGKSTTMKMLTCFIPPSSGTASIDGVSLDQPMEVRRRIGYLPENAPSYHDLDVYTHLQFMGRMYGLPEGLLAERIRQMGEVCGLSLVMHRRIEELSKGYRQRVGLAASMLHDPDCLILDEPTTGLDPNQIVEVRHLIRQLGEKKTVLLSSHVLSEVEAACDRLMVIDGGALRALGTTAELTQQAQGGVQVQVTLKEPTPALQEAIQGCLEGQCADVRCSVMADGSLLFVHADPQLELAEHVFRAVVQAGGVILDMRRLRTTLEDVFHKLTHGVQT